MTLPYTAPAMDANNAHENAPALKERGRSGILEHETGIEPATSTLAILNGSPKRLGLSGQAPQGTAQSSERAREWARLGPQRASGEGGSLAPPCLALAARTTTQFAVLAENRFAVLVAGSFKRATKLEASCLANSLAKVCKATEGDGFTDYRVMDEAQACIDRENGFAHAAWHGHKEARSSPRLCRRSRDLAAEHQTRLPPVLALEKPPAVAWTTAH